MLHCNSINAICSWIFFFIRIPNKILLYGTIKKRIFLNSENNKDPEQTFIRNHSNGIYIFKF
jgi:hypothetical protein